LVLGLLACAVTFGPYVYVTMFANKTHGDVVADFEQLAAVVGGVCTGIWLGFSGFCLGVGGATQQDRKKLWVVLGLILNGLVLLAVLLVSLFFMYAIHQAATRS
jgi:hypothetical protein